MIKFVAICPHPPLIIPGIGKENDLKYVDNTIKAMQQLAHDISDRQIDTILIVSPHGLIYPDRMNICYGGEFAGDFSQFSAKNICLDFLSNDKLANAISKHAQENGILTNENTENYELDHGVMVPMYYLAKHLPEDIKIIPINYSYQDINTHFKFGQLIREVCESEIFTQKNIALIASGDMSHRLFEGEIGKQFDKKIQNDLSTNNTFEILNYDPDWLEQAGECGYRSIVILLGAIDGLKYSPKILSYEGPFGVGYLVANMQIGQDK